MAHKLHLGSQQKTSAISLCGNANGTQCGCPRLSATEVFTVNIQQRTQENKPQERDSADQTVGRISTTLKVRTKTTILKRL